MKLTELPKNFDLKRERIKKQLDHAGVKYYHINRDLTVTFYGAVNGQTLEQFNPPLKTMVGSFEVGRYRPIKDFTYFPFRIERQLYIFNATTLHNLHKYVKFVGEEINITNNQSSNPQQEVPTNILSLLLIKGNFEVICNNLDVTDILNKHLKGGRDIIACQDELIDAGFAPQAAL